MLTSTLNKVYVGGELSGAILHVITVSLTDWTTQSCWPLSVTTTAHASLLKPVNIFYVTRTVPHYYANSAALLREQCRTTTRTVPHYYANSAALLREQCRTTTRTVPHYYANSAALLREQCCTATRTVPHCYVTFYVTRTVPHYYANSAALLREQCRTAT